MTGYIFDNAIEAQTATRFDSLDLLYNPRTFEFLGRIGVGPGWHCLEVGGGSGSVAAWLSERVGASGSILVTDIEPRFIEACGLQDRANIEVRRHDIGTDPLPERAFDLIHARLVLLHVSQRADAFERLIGAMKPGGWIVLEEFDGRLVDRAIPTKNATDAAAYRKMVQALWVLMDERGFDAEWPRELYGRLRAAGLVEVGMEGHIAVCEGGSLGARLDAANFTQVREEVVAKGLITHAEVDSILTRLTDPNFAGFSPLMFTACGRRL